MPSRHDQEEVRFELDIPKDGIKRQIVIVESPPWSPHFTQVTCMMSDDELAEAKRERPDLVFRIPDSMEIEKDAQEAVKKEPEGVSVNSMILPAELFDTEN